MSSSTKDELLRVEDESGRYQRISGLAVFGLLVGALSALALEHLAFLFVPMIAIAINWRALGKIRDLAPHLSGRRLALAGLAMSLIFGISGLLIPAVQFRADRYQALQVARGWFEALRDNRPDVAHQWTLARWLRVKEGDYVPSHYANHSGKKAMSRFLTQPTVRALLNLGKQARVSYYANLDRSAEDQKRTVVDAYAVTVLQRGERVSFLLKLTVVGRLDTLRKQWSWELASYEIMNRLPSS